MITRLFFWEEKERGELWNSGLPEELCIPAPRNRVTLAYRRTP